MKHTYKITFNDFGITYVQATHFSDAEAKFRSSNYMREKGVLKSIALTDENTEPL